MTKKFFNTNVSEERKAQIKKSIDHLFNSDEKTHQKIKKEKIPTEEWEQKQIFIWARGHQIEFPSLKWLNGSLNGFRLSPGLRKKSKEQGSNKGYPDINLPIRTDQYNGLYIELKRIKGGKISTEQKEWREHLNSQGYLCVTCKGHDKAIWIIKAYLDLL